MTPKTLNGILAADYPFQTHAVVEVGCVKDLQQLCQKTKITCPADYVEVESIPSIAEVNKEIKMEVINTIKKHFKCHLYLECQIK